MYYCVSTVKMLTRTRYNVTLPVHCLYCILLSLQWWGVASKEHALLSLSLSVSSMTNVSLSSFAISVSSDCTISTLFWQPLSSNCFRMQAGSTTYVKCVLFSHYDDLSVTVARSSLKYGANRTETRLRIFIEIFSWFFNKARRYTLTFKNRASYI
jgi:hypothetical protein